MRGEEDDADDADLSTSAGIIYKARVASHRKQHTTCTKWGFFEKWTRTTWQLRIRRSYISFKSRYEDLCRHCCISCILHTRTCIIQIHIRLNKLKGFRLQMSQGNTLCSVLHYIPSCIWRKVHFAAKTKTPYMLRGNGRILARTWRHMFDLIPAINKDNSWGIARKWDKDIFIFQRREWWIVDNKLQLFLRVENPRVCQFLLFLLRKIMCDKKL